MLPEEAMWLRGALDAVAPEELSPLVDLGSSTRHFREVLQPFIAREIFAPLAARGVRVIHCDAKPDDGVDIVGDVHDPGFAARLRETNARAVLCANMFEHVADRATLVRALTALVPPGGRLLLTVPRSFPYHPDPIDTYFRPTPEVLAGLFPGWRVVESGVVTSPGYYVDIRRRPWVAVRHAVRSFMPFYQPRQWPAAMHKWLWVLKDYAVTCVSLQRPAE